MTVETVLWKWSLITSASNTWHQLVRAWTCTQCQKCTFGSCFLKWKHLVTINNFWGKMNFEFDTTCGLSKIDYDKIFREFAKLATITFHTCDKLWMTAADTYFDLTGYDAIKRIPQSLHFSDWSIVVIKWQGEDNLFLWDYPYCFFVMTLRLHHVMFIGWYSGHFHCGLEFNLDTHLSV